MSEKPQTVYRNEYRRPDFQIDRVELHFELGEEVTLVRSRLSVRRSESLAGEVPPLVLVGEDLTLNWVRLDGQPLSEKDFGVGGGELTLPKVPENFTLEIEVQIKPQENLALSGLYKTSGNFCTQCEAMGFRRITYFLDRPDVMSLYRTVIDADRELYPVLLSNGNRVETCELEDGRHRVVWEDPIPKPCYLFALVAGQLVSHCGSFTTMSGRTVQLEIWVESQNIDRCKHALESLKKSMAWDEEKFGREYDLDIYMIVAVNDFNMGAMENKGLNVFNSKYVLALPETATDDDYEGIEAVIAHEYFHNWTGNRVTCRDWFQLTLKEGLTVFRDEQFTADMTSKAVKRIDDVRLLRLSQFPEDNGPMAHPIRPESYISMDNFYTATVYNKGAEVIRMYHTLLGEDGFRKGMDLYFERHDGQAVTCDDFRAAMADANQVDLDQFERWYLQAGTPVLEVATSYDASQKTFDLDLTQSYTANAAGTPQDPLHMPVCFGLLGSNGRDLPLHLEGEDPEQAKATHVLELREGKQRFRFTGVQMPEGIDPVPSVLRNFSAPVKLVMKRSKEELAFAMANDADSFNRWDAGQTLAQQVLLGIADDIAAGRKPSADELFSSAFGKVLKDDALDGSLKSLALILPPERQLAQEREVIDVDELFSAREFLKQTLVEDHGTRMREIYDACRKRGPYGNDAASVAARRLQNAILGYLIMPADAAAREVAASQFRGSDNMTDSQAALACLVDLEGPECQEALESFYQRWQDDPLVLDKWFSTQALCKGPTALNQVLKLSEHPDYSLKNPNRVRSLLGSFCAGNQVRFHDKEGGGYTFLAKMVMALDPMNPQVAARMVSLFNQWRRFDQGRQGLMRAQLELVASQANLSKDVTEIVTRALRDES